MDQNAQARGITSVYADGPHRICIGSESALLLVDLESGRRRTLPKAVTHALRAASGELWLSTPNGVLVLDSALGSMRAITRKQGLRGVNSTCCLQLRDGSILVASLDGGLTLSDPAFTHPRRLGMEQGLSAEAVLTLCETRKGSVLIGTSGGLDEFNPANGTLRHATLGGMRPQAAIAALSQDDAGRIWIGSEGEGVAVLDHEKDILLRYTSASGLPSMHVASFVQRGGVMYCGTSNGLAQFTPLGSGFAVGSIGSAQGLSRLVFARQAAAVAGDGSAYWGAGDAVLRSASAATPDTGAPQVFVSGLDIKDRRESFLTARWLQRVLADTAQSIRRNAAAGKDATSIVRSTLRDEGASWDGVEGPYCLPTELCLAAGQGQLTFHFTGGSAAGGRTRYRYLLEGNDAAWSASSERTQAEYRNLAPGSYVFVVRCQSADGRWSAPARFAFVIAAPFWRSWWAYALYALLLAALIVAGIREQKRRLFRRELAGSRLRETELRSTLLQTENERNEALLDKEKEATEASQTLRELREQQELYTQRFWTGLLAQLDSGEGDAPLADLNVLLAETAEAEAQYIRSALPDFQCALHTDFASALPPLPIARQDLARAVSALLRNAYEAVHEKRLAQGADSGYAPGIGLRTSLQDGRVEILVSDNGPGIPEPLRELIFEPCFTSKGGGTHGGLGLALARHLVAAQGGSITLRSRSGVGTEFVISLPV
jgi:signal transduction histidine kinase